ncbi:bifunctional tetrahydrofolate synthase/dihydrofolate synthase [Snodgrassella alvi]|uniref:bifunctional tetrahydrofolate synthase/dihydrofolate synthase n=1 Tax=Snodgrassella alvi TaxID=1196083 RepID=UPI000A024B28|nr:bifunctional tetrahydrofolate synthase/dihydrofolate synthase [Snodgrassella alvi]ORF28171.1 bifunctional tetrahydrofolate synthase/dihydrofolate synthase [Snodgrassella alvi]ORF31903.1 bifunctional tetrahydrofolate synthase/dihydrofolate synthase [Snodgrassella alvi]ORF35138.1 bifunctional tetrahydrofolate synthase/dihydrofolate synthase [Snodgrassella alvi]ORF39320.1 bifunctional tetrahydrofolate synthase/dihydrofolate synthase [Snodgrassella alvi]ORF41250.1 bifunctional tetrahydrofolate 
MTEKFHATGLSSWLQHLENGVAGGEIEMGLARVGAVRDRMGLKPVCPLIVVGGTNGKGSVCAYLTQIYHEAGYRVGTLTSPHLLRFNERIAINGEAVADDLIVSAFEHIETARAEIPLTYFEFNTLAAVEVFIRQQVDVMILEVGLGGRLDAVNIFDADVAVITSVDLDHEAFLGDTVEKVAFEKAGIMRAGKPVICAQIPVPHSLSSHAAEVGADLLLLGRDFDCHKMEMQQWSYRFHPQESSLYTGEHARHALPIPVLRGNFQLSNAACALTVLECLSERLPLDIGAIKRGLLRVRHPGRFQVLPGRPVTVLDVGHNPHAARALRSSLIALPYAEKRMAVFSMLADKDIDAVLEIIKDQFDCWLIAPLALPRGMTIQALQEKFIQHNITAVTAYPDVKEAYQAALSEAGENDRIVVFGSFHTVAEIIDLSSR